MYLVNVCVVDCKLINYTILVGNIAVKYSSGSVMQMSGVFEHSCRVAIQL